MFENCYHSALMPYRGSSLDLESQEAIGRRLKALRLALDKTQLEMAALLGSATSGQIWGNYETAERRISLDQAKTLVKLLNISLDWIYLGRLNYLPIDLADKIRYAEIRITEETNGTKRRA